MFRFFRKHRWILILAMTITAITFVFFMGSGNSRNRGSDTDRNLGTIYGHQVTPGDYKTAERDFYLSYWFRNGSWPKVSEDEAEEYIYQQLLLNLKVDRMEIHVTDEAAGAQANNLMRALEQERVNFDTFKTRILPDAGMTEADFIHFVRYSLAIQQLIQTIGVSGELITPQQAADLYQREHQETSAEMVYFSASNYLSQITVTPEVVAQFYTNYMAAYRQPDRVQVSYVAFAITNYHAAAEQKLGKTNLDLQVETVFRQRGIQNIPGAKTPEEAKARIREAFIQQEAEILARADANQFATEVFGKSPVKPENLALVAKDKNVPLHTTAPFSSQYGPQEFMAPDTFTKAAFRLTPDEPLSEVVQGTEAYYVIALDKRLPSEIPAFAEIRDRVTHDYQMVNAAARAQSAGTNAAAQIMSQLAAGKTFTAACTAAGAHPEALPPFSLSSGEMPALEGRGNLFEQVKRVAFNLLPGQASGFIDTDDGGFVLFVSKRTPADANTMKAALPEFTAQLRNMRSSEFFNIWLMAEKNRELKDTPLFKRPGAQQNKS